MKHKLAFSFVFLFALALSASAQVRLSAGDDLQKAINSARRGETITLEAGAAFVGNFVLPLKDGSEWITVQSSRASELAEGRRIVTSDAPKMARILTPNVDAAIKTAPGARHYRFIGIEITTEKPEGFSYHLVKLGDGKQKPEDVPYYLTFDRCHIYARDNQAIKRGVELNSSHTEIINSRIAGFKVKGQEAQGVGGWNTPGNVRIENNHIEGAGENVIFGGADPSISGLVPSDIQIIRNHLYKPSRWRAEGWTVKNILELKNARRVRIEGNILENNWLNAQTGEAVLFTPRNQDGTAPWSTVEDVEFVNNIVRNASSAFLMLGRDYNHPSGELQRIKVANNLFENLNRAEFGGRGAFLVYSVPGGEGISIERNTILHTGTLIAVGDAGKGKGFKFNSNVARHNEYNLHGSGVGGGSRMFDRFFDGWEWQGNVIAGAAPESHYPPGTRVVSSLDTLFVDLPSGDYRLKSNLVAGCDIAALRDAMAPPKPKPPPAPGVCVTDRRRFLTDTSVWCGELLGSGWGVRRVPVPSEGRELLLWEAP